MEARTTSEVPQLTLVASTLVFAASLHPLRLRLIDRVEGRLREREALRAVGEADKGAVMEEEELPKFAYQLDEPDPDVAVLRRQDGTIVATFSARGATREGILEAKEDYRRLVEAQAASGTMVREEDDERRRSA
jgi:hypothetical protein